MPDDIRSDQPTAIWKNQAIEVSTMNIVKIHLKAQALQTRTRKELARTAAGPLVVIFCITFCWSELTPIRETLAPWLASALVWSLAGVYFLIRGKRSASVPEDAGFSTGLEFCRQQIERQREVFRRSLVWGFGPVVLALGTICAALAVAAGRKALTESAPFLILLAVWVVAYFIVRARRSRELQRELDSFSALEKSN